MPRWPQPAPRTQPFPRRGNCRHCSRRAAAGDQQELERAPEAHRQLGARLKEIIAEQSLERALTDVDRALRIRRYIAAHYHHPATVADPAADLGFSPDRTRHVVREACGENVRRLLERTRMSAAAALLLHSRLPVGEVAKRCGYTNSAAFARGFAPLRVMEQVKAVSFIVVYLVLF